MVDKVFRTRLDDFNNRLEEYSKACMKLENDVRRMIYEEIDRIFRIKTSQIPQVIVTYMKGYSRSQTFPELIRCLVTETHPIDTPRKFESEASDIEFTLRVTSTDNVAFDIPYSSDYEEFWQTCLRRMKENDTYKFVTEENTRILEDTRKLKEEIVDRIERPWKI